MGAFAGLIQGLGAHIQKENENNLVYQHQANREQAMQYDDMAQRAEAAGKWDLAADLHKASFAIRTTMPGQKPKSITNADGSKWDPLDMQGIIQKHTRLEMQKRQQQPQAPAPVAPNGITPAMTAPPGGGNAVPNPVQSIQSAGAGLMNPNRRSQAADFDQ